MWKLKQGLTRLQRGETLGTWCSPVLEYSLPDLDRFACIAMPEREQKGEKCMKRDYSSCFVQE